MGVVAFLIFEATLVIMNKINADITTPRARSLDDGRQRERIHTLGDCVMNINQGHGSKGKYSLCRNGSYYNTGKSRRFQSVY